MKTSKRPTPWFSCYKNYNPDQKVIIIGGGISGASTAYSLACKGYQVNLYECLEQIGDGASGNYQGILYGSFSGNFTPMLELSIAGCDYTSNLINKLLTIDVDFQNCGTIQLAHNERHLRQINSILNSSINKGWLRPDFCYQVNQQQMQMKANTKIACESGLFFPWGLWVSPKALINKLVSHNKINVFTNHNITDIAFDTRSKKWQITGHKIGQTQNKVDVISNGNIIDTAYNLVICNAHQATKFTQLSEIPLRIIRGQTTVIEQDSPLRCIICGDGYITPSINNKFTLGASFSNNNLNEQISIKDHDSNINNLKLVLPELLDNIKVNENTLGKVGFRTSSYDYAPLVGPIANHSKFNTVYAKLKKDKNYWIEEECPYLEGLYLNIAHGAKGLLTAPISGMLIANYIDNELEYSNSLSQVSEEVRYSLHPNRFWVKNLYTNHELI